MNVRIFITIVSLLCIGTNHLLCQNDPLLKLANISGRSHVGNGSFIIGGFAINEGTRNILVRAIGPSLNSIPNAERCKAPILSVYKGQEMIASNSGWQPSTLLQMVMPRSGAFPLPPGTKDSVVAITVGPGIYTAQIQSSDENAGIALLEIYDTDWTTPNGLCNISFMGQCGVNSDELIVGYSFGGSPGFANFLVRAIGPGLSQFGLRGFMQDPYLTIHNGSDIFPQVLTQNDDWQPTFANGYYRLRGAFPLPDGSSDASTHMSTRVSFGPSNVTASLHAIVTCSPKNRTGGIVLVEIYLY